MTQDNNDTLLQRITKLEASVEKIEKTLFSTLTIPVVTGSTKKQTLQEFLLSKKPTDGVKKTLCVVYYLEKVENLTPVNRKDLEAAMRRAKEQVPPNPSDKIAMATRSGFLAEAKEEKDNIKAFYLTNSGEAFVENGFKKN